ncbi:hemolysin family protein [Edaphobacter modestus]|uniref:CBS domain containing-hemolysin-like protein n=1 Tax=Edaphobacter modestus TaxID=388466 RepID=A0A4Q7YXM3_9BACT|nr:hemolysin family protein [Edaphobacter modestus]RZU42617.1 CBS domain containing-hemolysin-like protein [Edaphobacter modestus]
MNWINVVYALALALLLSVLALASYIDRVYSEMGKFLAREYQDNVDSWEQTIEPRLRLGRESIALSASVLRQLSLAAMSLFWGLHLYQVTSGLVEIPSGGAVARAIAELILLILVFDRLVPQVLFTRTRGLWIRRITLLLQVFFYLILPVTIVLQLLLSIAALAEPEDEAVDERPSEAMEALLEAGEEEGILEESDRELVRSVVEFGDKVVREVMTPRPEIFAVPGTLTLREFTAEINEHAFSRVPVYSDSLDHITGIAFAHDLLKVLDIEAGTRTVAQIQRPAAFVPETKMVAELLGEMQREKQHMRIVIDEYGGVAGLVTIEDLLEAIVGDIADEHDEPEPDAAPVREPDGSYIVPGSFEVSRLRELFADQIEKASTRPAEDGESSEETETGEEERERSLLSEQYESTTLGGLVSEMAGRIPAPGEIVEEDGLRMQVLASTDRRVDRLRVSLTTPGLALSDQSSE